MNEQHNKPVTIQLIIVTVCLFLINAKRIYFFLQINNIEGHNLLEYICGLKKTNNKPGK